MTHYALFDTAIGWAGIAWGDRGLVGVHLPERDPETARRSFLRRFPDAVEAAVPPEHACTIADICALMRGEKPDLLDAPLDLSRTPDFHARVYEITRAIPPGETLTYGEIAVRLGDKLLALKALLPFYRGQVKCIFIDPPYNTQSAFEHYDDRLEHSQWLSIIDSVRVLRPLFGGYNNHHE